MFKRIINALFGKSQPVKQITPQEELQQQLAIHTENLSKAKKAIEVSSDQIRGLKSELDSLQQDLNDLTALGDAGRMAKKKSDITKKQEEINERMAIHNSYYDKIESFNDEIASLRNYAKTMNIDLDLANADLNSHINNVNSNIGDIKQRMEFELNKTKAKSQLNDWMDKPLDNSDLNKILDETTELTK